MIELEAVTFSYDETPVVDGLSLTIQDGELVGLIGPNGAGKTTIIRLVAGTVEPDQGAVRVEGDEVSRLSSKAVSQRVAVVPQRSELSFDFQVSDVVLMGRHPYRSKLDAATPADRDRVDTALELTGTSDLAERPFSAISGGERKRVLFARAIAQDTPNLLLDEPTASLDINHQIEVFSLAADFVADEIAVLAAVHDLDIAARFCDRLVLVHEGEVLASGSPEAVLTPSRLKQAYGIETEVITHPVTGAPTVIPAPTESARALPSTTDSNRTPD